MNTFEIAIVSILFGLLSGCSRPSSPLANANSELNVNDVAFVFLDWSSPNRDIPPRSFLIVPDTYSKERIVEIEKVVDSCPGPTHYSFTVPPNDVSVFVSQIWSNELAIPRVYRGDAYYAYLYTMDSRLIRIVCVDMSVDQCSTFKMLLDVVSR
jgi:hypothetical protein